MNTSGTTVDSGQVDFEVSNLSEELVLVSPPVVSTSSVWVRVEHSNTLEIGRCDNSGKIIVVSDKLCVIVLNDGA